MPAIKPLGSERGNKENSDRIKENVLLHRKQRKRNVDTV